MARILYLVHRLPYPPNKGDKLRSYHLLKHLAASHEVVLGSFIDDAEDWAHVPALRESCADVFVAGLNPLLSRVASLRGLVSGEALSLPYYRHRAMRAWIDGLARGPRFDAIVVFSSTMAQYALQLRQAMGEVPMLVDFVDVDSAKWTDYAKAHRWPMSWLYRREGRELLAYERQVAEQARCSFFVTESEKALFQQLSASRAKVEALCNGVDSGYFSPLPAQDNPFEPDELPLVFTGAMDYWPNVDAVQWFASEVLPGLRQRWPRLKFTIVGRSPTPAVQALAGDAVRVTGTVPDVRPYLQHAAAVVAPLRLARGVQNKILEAMAVGRPVVAARSCVEALSANGVLAGQDLLSADSAGDYLELLHALLAAPQRAQAIGQQARERVLRQFSWHAHLSRLDHYLPVTAKAAA
ncbi:TIGR03087 family PEP-CTERM/XrtA system glycosyltransferase [Roseateles depolymerans]|uniref:Sugar transferase n=1 Tax=Roseateles depolymerans TaxID=76731 RepID=A0A0U3MD74_9BURK|nr:TIGR03087 family PEP-CTERM/XrtA system glycosyltransferase [Roseateles depolymerans]ALV06297.1 sugar transferase [Roseateles depolymerans]REG19267.1 sugar transferase (PEP-CTERM/EpsH1 system associated) [Roseateles depolymerans]